MSLDPQLLEILACPDTHHAPLAYDEAAQTLTCYRVRQDLPHPGWSTGLTTG